MDDKIKKWIVNLDTMKKVGFYYTKKQAEILINKYSRLGYNVSFDQDGWMCIDTDKDN